jgi:hypothetical protein
MGNTNNIWVEEGLILVKLKGVQAKTSSIEISASKNLIYSLLVNFCVSNVKANIPRV